MRQITITSSFLFLVSKSLYFLTKWVIIIASIFVFIKYLFLNNALEQINLSKILLFSSFLLLILNYLNSYFLKNKINYTPQKQKKHLFLLGYIILFLFLGSVFLFQVSWLFFLFFLLIFWLIVFQIFYLA